MDKDEMIEKMAKVLCDNDKRCDECISRLLLPCGYKSYCKKLYNAGYRKVADDEQIVNTEQLNETLNSVLESGKHMGYAQGRQETARAILQEIMSVETTSDNLLKNTEFYEYVQNEIDKLETLAKKYGVEMVGITGDFKDLSVEETRKMAEAFDLKLDLFIEDWFYNLPSTKRCTIDKSIFEEMNKRGKDE